MPQHPVRNRAVAGAFLLAAAAAALAILVLLGKWENLFRETQMLHVQFKAAPNIRVGSPVLMAGHPVGTIDTIKLVERVCAPDEKNRTKCYMVDIVASIPTEYAIHKDARITLTQPLIGTAASLNIEDVGSEEAVVHSLLGTETSPFGEAAKAAGVEPQSITIIVKNVEDITGQIKAQLPEILKEIRTTSDNLVQGSKKVNDTLDKVNLVLDDNRENLKAAVANTKDLTADAKKDAAAILADVKTAAGDLKKIIETNREKVNDTLTHIQSIAEKTEKHIDSAGGIIENVKTTAVTLKAGVEDFKIVAADAKVLVANNRRDLNTTLQNFKQMSDHLLALSEEVRRAPWRLFSTPDKKEVESLNLYDVARAFAMAAADLKNCSESVQVMMENADKGVRPNDEVLKDMHKRLDETFDNYKKAQDKLLKEFDRVQKQ